MTCKRSHWVTRQRRGATLDGNGGCAMIEERPTRGCAACGWPALAETRRCPFCRAQLRPTRRAGRSRLDRLDPLAIIAGTWVASSLIVAGLALALVGGPWAALVLLPLCAPFVALLALRQRTVARVRSLGRPRRGHRAEPGATGGDGTTARSTSRDGGD